jgi:hypothetical protein
MALHRAGTALVKRKGRRARSPAPANPSIGARSLGQKVSPSIAREHSIANAAETA